MSMSTVQSVLTTVKFGVRGKPEPAGSKKAIPTRPNWRHAAGVRWKVVDANDHADKWKKTVGNVARVAMLDAFGWNPQPMTGPIYAHFEFLYKRPPSHLLSDGFGISASGRQFLGKTSAPDALKLARGVEDAMTGIVYVDDAQIVEEVITKAWGNDNGVNVIVSQIIAKSEPRSVWAGHDVPEDDRLI